MDAEHLPLGKTVSYTTSYDPSLLCPVKRGPAREQLGIFSKLPFYGEDLWTAFELSWLNAKGKPVIAMGEFFFPCSSPNIVESKSFKLYCNSFNQTRFDSMEMVEAIMIKDLSRLVGEPIRGRLLSPAQFEFLQVVPPEGECLDELDIDVLHYQLRPELLETENQMVTECLHSHLLRTNCPVTGQPDWATVVISYNGREIRRESLLAYLISYRLHTGFHENCVETIFSHIVDRCKPDQLTVYGRFTRRGGIDINPYRSTDQCELTVGQQRLARQ